LLNSAIFFFFQIISKPFECIVRQWGPLGLFWTPLTLIAWTKTLLPLGSEEETSK